MRPGALARVVVVDDNPDLRDNLRETLEAAGYAVVDVGTCAGARTAAAEGFDVALVDLRLPDGDGVSLAAGLSAASPDAAVVLLTGFATVESAADAVRAGAFAYLLKPCKMPELLMTVEQALRQVQLRREKRELGRRAQVAERLAAVGTMTAGLSHEIRNPLNAAAMQLTVLERRVRRLEGPEQPSLLAPLLLVRDEIQRLNQILEDFLQFARPREVAGASVELAPLLTRVVDLLRGDAEQRRLTLSCDVKAGVRAHADEGLLRQVVMNLALNALQAAPVGGWVRLEARTLAGEILLAVEDNGPGVPEAARERIFEPFFTTKAEGSGLGLSIVHAIVTQHGGSLALTPGSDGGARFEIRLPLGV